MQLDGVACAGHERTGKRLAVRANGFRQLQQDAIDFFDLLDLELADAIPSLDRRWWLDEQRSTRCGCVVNDPTDGALRFAPNWNHESAVANGYRHVGHALARLQFRHRALEQVDQLTSRTL